jgi:hypothetical protein
MYAFHRNHVPNHLLKTLLWAITGVGLLAILFAACATPHESPAPAKVEPTVKPTVDSHGLHAVRNSDLRSIMHKLQSLKLSQTADEIEITGELQRDICEVATIAESLAADAQLIPLLLRDDAMTAEAQRVMGTMSARMRFQAEELAAAANRSDLDGVRRELDAMLSTCTACHLEFRAPALAFAKKQSSPWQTSASIQLGGLP